MKEIAVALEAKLVCAQELKDFLSNICCESYSNLDELLGHSLGIRSNVKELHGFQDLLSRICFSRMVFWYSPASNASLLSKPN